MARDARYGSLFEPVEIGPVSAKNRFYQMPRGTGMGYDMARNLAAFDGNDFELACVYTERRLRRACAGLCPAKSRGTGSRPGA